jgi:hypothetical protein
MTDLFDLTLATAIELGIVQQGVATGGGTNTIIDTNLLADVDDDYYNAGTAWCTEADGAAPEGEYSVISDFAASTDTVTLQNQFSVAIAADDRYAVGIPRYPLDQIIQALNNALFMDGYIPKVDTSITTVLDQREYDLPLDASRDLRQVWLYTNLDSDRNIPRPVYNYDIRKTAGGTQDILVLNQDYTAGYTIELLYAVRHAALVESSDALDEVVHPDRIVFEAAVNLMRQYRDRTRLKHLDSTIDELTRKSEVAKIEHPLPMLPPRQSKIGIFGNFQFNAGMFGPNT